MALPNPKWFSAVSTVLDVAAAVDKGGGEVGLPITAHTFVAAQIVIIAGSVNYNGAFTINSKTANEIVITATYVAEVFTGAETVVFGKQPILKDDFVAIENAIINQPLVRMQPPLTWDNADQVSIQATADCQAQTALTGMPNILNYTCQVSGSLSDGKIRTITAPVMCAFPGDLYGTTQTRKVSQWYVVYALAGDDDADFDLKAMPIMRVKSQTGQAIKTGTLPTPASGINYGFTDNDALLVGGKLYFLTGDSIGLMRAVSANDIDTDTRITYTGAALSVAAGDWFIILPPTNFRMVGRVFNNSADDIEVFFREGNIVQRNPAAGISCARGGVVEDIRIADPFAIRCGATLFGSGAEVGHPDITAAGDSKRGQTRVQTSNSSGDFQLKFCRYQTDSCTEIYPLYYILPEGGF